MRWYVEMKVKFFFIYVNIKGRVDKVDIKVKKDGSFVDFCDGKL